ncbi:MAG: AbrB/MazE/SpoVT family DNA-binding domain-containing protein [Alicyclobacillus herbarius]|uniref:AbrB/MazE/SpoVT family DNA-binding domain-containing protein n=1 Tax=Alicyclobacillus herbarius TaxID=122960 RepID=UPI002354E0E4|nr:AbrB/MazE/SpoVT family DNA-binding domain-containing protein [Alicyclobacillus herbarius]MCL6634002.1 AbrB/MazE/SpoVT family DNA-binding domain-containing protein [Alicyclobacillus herbarius]
MEATGIVRKIDVLGRISIPAELRKEYAMETGADVEFIVDADRIILQRFEPGCVFCGNHKATQVFHDKIVCRDCWNELTHLHDPNNMQETLILNKFT